MRIAVDAMGGDHAPDEIVKGAVDAARRFNAVDKIYLVGDESAIKEVLNGLDGVSDRIEVRHASEVVGMEEAPAVAIRRKKDSSIGRAVDMIKNGEADAVFSAGNTGAAVAATTLKLRTLPGVDRPAIAAVIPTPTKPFVLIDAGANTDCPPEWLCQFAVMGGVYSQVILKRNNPVVGLLNIGGEEAKGNEATKEAHRLLSNSRLNFRGNVESKDIFEGVVDVVVCDGFVGNMVLKTSESVAGAISRWIKDEFTQTTFRMIGAMMLKKAIGNIKQRSDPENYGGAPLLGANGACIIGHGASSALAVSNAIRVASEWVSQEINQSIEREIGKFPPE